MLPSPPHRSGRAELPHPAPRATGSLRDSCPCSSRQRQGVVPLELSKPPPAHVSTLTPPAKPATPDALDIPQVAVQRCAVARHSVVVVVACELLRQHGALLGDRPVTHSAAPPINRHECPVEATLGCLALHDPVAAARPRPVVWEAEQIETTRSLSLRAILACEDDRTGPDESCPGVPSGRNGQNVSAGPRGPVARPPRG